MNILLAMVIAMVICLARHIIRFHSNRITRSKNICRALHSEHILGGNWIEANFAESETWPCCGWDGSLFLKYPSECGSSAMEKRHGSYIGNKKFYAHSGGHGCSKNCDISNNQIISATWTPSNCHLPKFDPQLFCDDVLQNRSILIMGDSTMEQTASILMNAVHHVCPERIRFVTAGPDVGKRLGKLTKENTWYYIVNKWNNDSDIIMLSTGAWIKNQSDFKQIIHNISTEFKRRFENDKILIWKTQSPGGNPDFGIVDDFTHEYLEEQLKKSSYKSRWGWPLFPVFDKLAKEHFRQNDIPVLDVSPLYQRQDNHPGIDVHHCAHGNGALRVIPRILQQLLREIRNDA